jgi:hypothetical protein
LQAVILFWDAAAFIDRGGQLRIPMVGLGYDPKVVNYLQQLVSIVIQ